MPRFIVYDRQVTAAERTQPTRPYGRRIRPTGDAAEVLTGDDYAARLMKYIPAEALAFVIFGTAFPDESDLQLAAVVLVGAVGQFLWLRLKAKDPEVASRDRPGWHFFVLAVIAYFAWVIGTCTPVTEALGIDKTTAVIVVASVAYLLPLIDPTLQRALNESDEPAFRR